MKIQRVIPVILLMIAVARSGIASDLSQSARFAKLDEHLAHLQAEIADLKADLDDREVRQERAAQLASLTDHARRELPPDARFGAHAGYDDGFSLEDAPGNFRVELSGQLQTRYAWSHQRNAPDHNDDKTGFELRRAKLKLTGHIFDPRLQYAIGGSFDRGTGIFEQSDIYFDWNLSEDLTLRLGRYRTQFLREEIMSSKRLLFADRSLVRFAFSQQRRSGLGLSYKQERLRVFLSAQNSESDDFSEDGWLFAARGDLLLAGEWDQFKQHTAARKDIAGLLMGGGVLAEYDDPDDSSQASFDTLRWTTDLSLKGAGANLLLAVVGNHSDTGGIGAQDQFGAVIQGGLRLTDRTELLARCTWGDADDLSPSLSIVTLGLNQYVHGHDAKLTLDIGYGICEVGDFWAASGANWRADSPGSNGQIVLRTQFQVLF